jgi:predicted transcriptional regulator
VKHQKPQPWAPAGKLNPEDVEAIRRDLTRADVTQRDLGRAYGVHESTVSRIANGKSWREVAPK